MSQGNLRSNFLVKVLSSAILVMLITLAAFLWSIYSSRSENLAMEKQLANQATQIAKQDVQIALSAELNGLLSERATVEAEDAYLADQIRTPDPATNSDYAPTATALAIQSIQVEATRQAIDAKQQEVEATQTAIAQPLLSMECASDDYIPPFDGIAPPLGRVICVPSGTIGWISSDAARFSIPGIYDKSLAMGFTFALFGPARFLISGVPSNNVRLDLRSNTSLVGNYDGKSLNLVYQGGKVCDHAVYTGSHCP